MMQGIWNGGEGKMSMQLLTIMQFIGVFGIYAFLTVVFPSLVFYRKFKSEPFHVRFLIYITFGNFYVMNLVFLLQILHISNRYTLIVGTVVPAIAAIIRFYRLKPVKGINNFLQYIVGLLKGTIGIRLLLRRISKFVKSLASSTIGRAVKSITHSGLEWLCTVAVICVVLWMYGTGIIKTFGYSASDLAVHNYWINEMGKNNIFAAGIYPFGFHCVVYFIHAVFGVKTYILLRLFGVVQTLFIHLVMLAFLRACCKSKYIPYAAVGIFVSASFFDYGTYFRYSSALPQEFGMIFILPSIYFIFRFFEIRKKETAKLEKKTFEKGRISLLEHIKRIKRAEAGKKQEKKESPETYIISDDSDGFNKKFIEESLALCKEIKEFYSEADGDIQTSDQLFEDIASSMQKAESYHPWDRVIDELHGRAGDEVITDEVIEDKAADDIVINNDYVINSDDAINSEYVIINKAVINDKNVINGGENVTSNEVIKEESAKRNRLGSIKIIRGKLKKNSIERNKEEKKDISNIKGNESGESIIKNKIAGIWRIKSNLYLMLFSFSFSMTLAVHFYDTMVAGIFCIGIVFGYFFRLFRKAYFGRVILAGILSIVIAVLPMAAAFIGGKPLQGSLGWGMNVIMGSMDDDSESEEEGNEESRQEKSEHDKEHWGEDNISESKKQNTDSLISADDYKGGALNASKPSIFEKIYNKAEVVKNGIYTRVHRVLLYFNANLSAYVLSGADGIQKGIIFVSIWLDILFGAVVFIRKERDYASQMISTGFCTLILLAVLSSSQLGIPAIMDVNRSRIYVAYMLPVSFTFAADSLIWILFGWLKSRRFMYIVSFVTSVSLAVGIVRSGSIRNPNIVVPFETNDAMICLTNIMKENDNETYTICSANDELRMVEEYGYHYEIITFLRKMEGDNYKDNLTIPTNKVYFFIEKRPIDYDLVYEGSGQYVSAEGAANPLVYASGLSIYQGKNRWIVMSRMYYWAKAFQKMYDKEMKVYYESDDFVCYVVEQNPYRLFDFSIDYWYNTREWIFE